jgi:capsular exopolysaccharide synthesis family protein
MSIVEKALSKLQGSVKPIAERRPTVETLPSTATRSTIESSAPAAAVNKEFVTRHRVTIDAAALQRAGILPQQADAMTVRNQFRRLKWPVLDEVQARRRESQPCAGAVMIASALPGEGKTFTTCNFALSIAREEDRRVILVDGDIAKAHLTDVFGLRERPGITEFLSQPSLTLADVLVATSIERLYLIPAGKFVAHVSELLSSGRMFQLLQELTDSGPGVVVLLDTSPVMATNEAQVLSRVVPQIVLVVRADDTPQSAVLEACNILGREKTSAVLNQAHGWIEGDAYNAGYGYYANEERER